MTESFLCLFQDKTICNSIPTVEYKKSWHEGGTGYLDGVKPTDDIFDAVPLAKFTDFARRSAIAIKYEVECPEGYERLSGEYAMTAFQRYTDSDEWAIGNHYGLQSVTETALTSGRIRSPWLENFIAKGHSTFKHTINYAFKNHEEIFIECSVKLSGDTCLAWMDCNTLEGA